MLGPTARPKLLALLAICLLAVAAAPAGASAAAGTGTVALGVGGTGKAAKALSAAGVKTSAIKPARKRAGGRIVLPVGSIAVASSAKAALRGGIAFRSGRRVAKLKSVQLVVGARRATVSAKVGKARKTVFAASLPAGKAKLDRAKTTAAVAGGKLALTRAGAKLLRARLGASGIVAGRLGTLAADARRGDSGTPRSGKLGVEPPLKVRPASAVDVADISIEWYPRDSWVRYLSSGVGRADGLHVSGGATKLPAVVTSSHPCSDASYSGSGSFDYGYRFAPRSGWYDPATGAAAIYGTGSVRFVWAGHQIDLAAANPEIELDGSGSRAIFSFTGRGDTAFSDQRADLVSLALADQPTVSGNSRAYTTIRGRLTANGQSVFAGFYPPPNDGFGCLDVSFTTP